MITLNAPMPLSSSLLDATGLTAEHMEVITRALDEHASVFKSEGVGYPSQGSAYSSTAPNGLAPALGQSIQGTLDDATLRLSHIKMFRLLTREPITKSTVHEATVINSKGTAHVDPFITEGGIGALSIVAFERLVARLKYLAEHIEVPDTAAVLQGLGPDPNLVALRTRLGIEMLLAKTERFLFEGDEDVSSTQFNGLRKAAIAGGNYVDLEGEAPSASQINDLVGDMTAFPTLATLNTAICDPRTRTVLRSLELAHGWYDKSGRGSDRNQITGPRGLYLTTDYEDVEIQSAPLIAMDDTVPTTSQGEGAPNMAGVSVAAPTAATHADSRFRSKDVGEYMYKFLPVGDRGYAAPITVGPVTVGAGERVPFTFTGDNAIPNTKDTNGNLRYYKVFRSEADKTEYGYIGQFARGVDGSGDPINTVWHDYNHRRPFKRPLYIMELSRDVMYWCQLMDMVRRPLANLRTTIPFLLYMMGALMVKIPKRVGILDNGAIKL